ncbi:hypothetical protein EP7_004288 [Isosphaeraceae bacterium EP7]
MARPTVQKILPGQTKTFTIGYDGLLPEGVGFATSGHTVSAANHYSGADAEEILGDTEPTIAGTDVSFVCTGVEIGQRFDITLGLILDDGTPSEFPEKLLLIGVEFPD